jgi:hypothetical protein
MLNLMPSGPAPRKAGAKLLLFYKTTKFLHIFYKIISKFPDFHALNQAEDDGYTVDSPFARRRRRFL